MTDQIQLPGVDATAPHTSDAAWDLEQWFTPPAVADRFVRWALRDVAPGGWILEPNAGDGALVRVALELGFRVVAVEVDRHWARELHERHPAAVVVCADFLRVDLAELIDYAARSLPIGDVRSPLPFARAILNPAFAIACPVIERCLRVAPRAAALLPSSIKHSADRSNFWGRHAVTREVAFADRPRFVGPKDIGAKTDFLALEVVALWPGADRPKCETEAPWRL